jgi:HK97 gp10 family phage protein
MANRGLFPYPGFPGSVSLLWRGEQVAAEIRRRARAALEEAGRQLLALAKELCPVDTGVLRDSLQVVVDARTMRVVLRTDVWYAHFVEFGTIYRPANMFMRIALAEMEPRFRAIIQQTMSWGTGIGG